MRLRKTKKLIISLIAIGIFSVGGIVFGLNGFFGGGDKIPSDTMTRGLAGYWNFDEGSGATATDASGNDNHGTLTSGPSWTRGKVGGALSFDGVDDYVSLPNNASLNLISQSDFTIEMWANFDTSESGDLFYQYAGANQRLVFRWGIGEGFYYNYTDIGNSTVGSTYVPWLPTNNQWYHIVLRRSINDHSIFVNGVLLSTYTDTDRPGNDINISYISSILSTAMKGLIDELRVYNRALSVEEVRYHYNRGGPVAQWKFDEGNASTTYDSTDNNNDGTIYGGTATWVAGKSGSALSFDGVDDYVDAGSGSSLNITNAISIESWVKINAASPRFAAVSRYHADGYYGMEIDASPSRNVRVELKHSGGTFNIISKSTVAEGVWAHVAFTWDGLNIRWYINGNLDKTSASAGNMAAGTASVRIGNGSDFTAGFMNGLIDDVRIYNYARSPDEIRLDYNAGFAALFGPQSDCNRDPGSCMTKNLAGYWNFDEGSGATATDASGNDNHGTLTGGPAWTRGAPCLAGASCGGALSFDGVDDNIAALNIGNVLSVEFWINDANATDGILELINNSTYISIAASAISATGFTSPTIYVNGSSASASLSSGWNHVVVTDIVAVAAASFLIGEANTDFMQGSIDEVKTYNRALSAEEVRYHYNRGGPVGWWKFNEGSGLTAYDSSGNTNTGTLQNNMATTSWASGKHGSALNFDGVDDYVSFGQPSSLDISVKTIEAWVNLNDLATEKIILAGNNELTNDYQFLLDSQKLVISRGSNSNGLITANNVITNTGTWYHVVGVDNGGTISSMQLYVNGVLIAAQTDSTNRSMRNGNILIGARQDSTAFFNGLIDDVRVYNYARTAEEIRLDYNAGFAALFGPQSDCNRDPGSCMTKNLAGYWSFDEGSGATATDASGNDNHGTLTSGPSWTRGNPPASGGGALSFDGSDDYVVLPTSASLNITGTNPLTITAWVKTSVTQGTNIGIMRRAEWAGYSAQRFYGLEFSNTFSGVIGNHSVDGDFNSVTASGTYTDDQWHFGVFVFDGNTLYIYVDGVSKATPVARTISGMEAGGDVAISRGSSHGGYFSGLIDDVRIYNRALSAEEVRYHYNRGGPVAQWKFDEGASTTAYDASGNGNTGVLTGGPTWVAGKYGSALLFDGVDDYVSVTDTTGSALDISSSISLGAWVYPQSFPSSDAVTIVTKSAAYYMSVNTSGQVQAYLDGTTNQGYHAMNTALTLNKWNYVFWTYDGNSVKLYLNGVLDKTVADSGSISTNNWIVGVGAEKGAGAASRFFNGLIDDVRIYNYARSQEQILQDYNNGFNIYFR